jgi:hypothetical protein
MSQVRCHGKLLTMSPPYQRLKIGHDLTEGKNEEKDGSTKEEGPTRCRDGTPRTVRQVDVDLRILLTSLSGVGAEGLKSSVKKVPQCDTLFTLIHRYSVTVDIGNTVPEGSCKSMGKAEQSNALISRMISP